MLKFCTEISDLPSTQIVPHITEIGACGLWTCKNMTAANCYMKRLL